MLLSLVLVFWLRAKELSLAGLKLRQQQLCLHRFSSHVCLSQNNVGMVVVLVLELLVWEVGGGVRLAWDSCMYSNCVMHCCRIYNMLFVAFFAAVAVSRHAVRDCFGS